MGQSDRTCRNYKMLSRLGLVSCILLQCAVANSVVKRQSSIGTRQIIDIVCSACTERLEANMPAICCKCIKDTAVCNNNLGRGATGPGATCSECLRGDCDSRCNEIGVDDEIFVDVRQGSDSRQCPLGTYLCCDPVDNEIFTNSAADSGQDVCLDSNTIATQDFAHGVVCGKRDSRVYYNAQQPDTFTNPGEWPWAVLILNEAGDYVGAGALVDNDVVVTVAHKVRSFTNNPGALKVRLGDWNPNRKDPKEDFDFVERDVDCVILHPEHDLDNTLANNVAVLKLDIKSPLTQPSVADVITLFSGMETPNFVEPERPGNKPEGVVGSNVIETRSALDLRLGLVADEKDLDPLGKPRIDDTVFMLPNYYNTICLPKRDQFRNYNENCWVASWGVKQERQREIDLPLLSRQECARRLGPTFERKGVRDWQPQPSEVCAGGEPGKDTCRGEGGAPLVCYDDSSDQYFLLGLVGYGFECNTTLPGVYTNMADPTVQSFVNSAIGNGRFCK